MTTTQVCPKVLHPYKILNEYIAFQGFRYFEMYLRGREELLLRVQNEQTVCIALGCHFLCLNAYKY